MTLGAVTRLLDLDAQARLVPDLARAPDDGSLELQYQPEIDLASGAVTGMEALLRWYHPQRGLMWPGQFLPVAESAGLGPLLGRWVLSQCIAEAAAWAALPPRKEIGQRLLWVNVSASQLTAPGFRDELAAALAAAQLPPGALGLEVNEETLHQLGDDAVPLLRRLRELGLALAIDDFGTWYSALGALGELPVDAVKLDARFVRGVGEDLNEDAVVEAVIRLAHARGLYVVAEWVEAWSEGARLCELGCDRAHGFLFAGPQRAERARWMLATGGGWQSVASVGGWDHVPRQLVP